MNVIPSFSDLGGISPKRKNVRNTLSGLNHEVQLTNDSDSELLQYRVEMKNMNEPRRHKIELTNNESDIKNSIPHLDQYKIDIKNSTPQSDNEFDKYKVEMINTIDPHKKKELINNDVGDVKNSKSNTESHQYKVELKNNIEPQSDNEFDKYKIEMIYTIDPHKKKELTNNDFGVKNAKQSNNELRQYKVELKNNIEPRIRKKITNTECNVKAPTPSTPTNYFISSRLSQFSILLILNIFLNVSIFGICITCVVFVFQIYNKVNTLS